MARDGNYCSRLQQDALNAIAAQLTVDRGTECTAPVIGINTEGSEGCGTFTISYGASGNVNYLFVHHRVLVNIEHDI